ncbi:MAG: Maf family protein [Christensenellaceae bacterium]|jgi:septum formation protein|nr:Maf family protein [Christensenellaceae bacterium]
MKVLLASESPRRRELLKAIFPAFDVCKTHANECYKGRSPEDTVKEIAKRKLRAACYENQSNYDLIIAADTLVYCDGRYLGKPLDNSEAFQMLTYLAGKTHSVYSGIAASYMNSEVIVAEKSEVIFHNLTDKEIEEYIYSHNLLDKAGAYAIQDGVVVCGFSGEYSNIMGLPLNALRNMLIKIGAL